MDIKHLLKLKFLVFFIGLAGLTHNAKAQYTACATCTGVPTYTLNFTSALDTVATINNITRNGSCCSDNNCIRFIVYLNGSADLLNFDVVNPSPSGSAYYSVNCGTLTSIGTPVCIYGQTLVCITYCKPGGDKPDYKITQTRVVKASPNKTVRVGCSAQMTVSGLSAPTITWTSVFPGTPGQYNSFLSCTSGCTLTNVTPTTVVTPYIDYKVSGTPNTICGGTSSDTVRIYIVPGLTTQVTPTNANVCSNSSGSIVLTASVSGGAPPYTYTWSTNANTQTVSVAPGNYTVLIKDTANSCPAIVNTVVVGSITSPTAPVVGANSPLCAGQTLSLTSNNSGGTTWNWTGPNSFTSSLQNPTIPNATIATSGNYSVTMTFSGCTGPPGIVNVTVHPIPAAPSPSNNSAICAGQNLNLSANTISGATYSWTGPNGFTSNLQNPTIVGAGTAASGAYTVYVTVNGCSGPFATTNVTVNPIPGVPTPSNNSPICAGSNLSLTASNVAGATYSWTGPNGFTSNSQNPGIAGAGTVASGVYSVNITVLGCTGSFTTTTATVNPIPGIPSPSNNSPICAGSNLNLFTPAVAGATYSWIGPNGFTSTLQNPSIVGAGTVAAGAYSVNVTVLGCTGSYGTTNATVYPIPGIPTPTNNSPICAGANLNLSTPAVAGATYSWTGPNGFNSTLQNPTIVGAGTVAAGVYSVNVTVNGCTGSFGTTTATINPIPGAPTPTSNAPICAGSNLSLTANSIVGASYSWSGPNGFTSTLQNPVIVGAGTVATGMYSVNVTVAGCPGSNGTTSVTVYPIPGIPTATNNSPICAGSNLILGTPAVAGATYSWTGPNGFTSNLQNPTIIGAGTVAAGVYSVNITVNGCTGSYGTTTATVYPIPGIPTATNNSPICAGSNLNLTTPLVAGATYSWAGPNGFTSNVQNPTIVGAGTVAAGVYSVNITVNGCTGSYGTTTATVYPIPAIPTASNNSPICAGSNLNLTTPAVAGASYSWAGPNGFTSTLQNPTIVGAGTVAAGVYSVNITVNGCTGSFGTTTATIHPIPGAPTPSNNSPICAGQNLNLSANTVSGATYSWTGPNGFTSTLQNPTIVGAGTVAAGVYSVSITVNGCTGTFGTTTATVHPIPSAPTPSNNSPICAGQNLNLTVNTVSGATYSWIGPNGFNSTTQNPTIVGAGTVAAGVYSVNVTVNGCTGPYGTTTATINPIPGPPTPTSNAPICAGSNLSLTANPIVGASYSWSGPNGFTSTLQNPVIVGAGTVAAGVYSVNVTVLGCGGSNGTTSVTVYPIPGAPTPSNNSAICAGQNLNLSANTVSGATYSWTGPNGFTSNLQNPTIVAAGTVAAGVYSVNITVNGCTGSYGMTTVTVHPIPAAPSPSNNSPICAGQNLNFTVNTVGGATYSWNGPNGFTSSLQNPTIVGAGTVAAGVYSVNVTVNGCTGPDGTTTATVHPIPAAPTPTSNSPICAGQNLNLGANTISGATYSWSGPNGFNSTLQSPTIIGATTLAAGQYSLFVIVNGCAGPFATIDVTVNPIPPAPNASNNSTICAGSTLSLSASTVTGATMYTWSGPNSFVANVQNPTIVGASTLASGVYSVYATVAGCDGPAGTTTVTVSPIPPAPTPSNNSIVCAGQTLSLSANTITNASYSWVGPNSFTSNIQNPTITNASTLASGQYSVFITVAGCSGPFATTDVTVNPIPPAPNASNNSTICEGQTLQLTASTNTAATGYNWLGPNSFSSNQQNPTITNAGTITAGVYSVYVQVGGCFSPFGTTTVVITPLPAAPSASNTSPICTNGNFTLMANTIVGATYNWIGPNSFSSNLQNPSIVGAGTVAAGVYSVYVTVNGCDGPMGVTTVSVSDVPAAPSPTSNSAICEGQTLLFNATNTATNAVFWWSGPNSFTANIPNPGIINAGTVAAGIYTVFVTVNGCPGPASTTSVTVIPTPLAPNAANNSSLCAGSTLSLTASNISGATYYWVGPNSFTSTTQDPVITNASLLENGTFSVYATVNGCQGPAGLTSVTIIPVPSPPTGNSNSPVCNGQDLTFTINPSGGIYSWTGPNGFTSSLQNPTISPATMAANGNYSVTITLLGCTSPVAVIGASVGTTPSAFSPTATTPLCVGATLSLSTTFSANVTYYWSGPNSFTAATQNPTLSNVQVFATGVYTVYGSINGCDGPPSTVTVVVDPPAFVDAGPVQDTICASAGTIALTGTVTGGGSTGGLWGSSGTGTFLPTNSLVTTYTMSLADVSSPSFQIVLSSVGGGCPTQSDVITFMVLGSPTVDVATSLNVCKNEFVPLSGTITGVTNNGTWTANGGTGTYNPGFNFVNGNYYPSSADTTLGSLWFVLTSVNNKGCLPGKDSVRINFITAPYANFINTRACTNQTISFNDASTPSPSIASYGWDFGDGNGLSSLANPTYSYSAIDTFVVTHIVTLTNGCKDTISKQLIVYNSAVADFSNTSVCVGYNTLFTDLSTITPDTLVGWNWTFGDGGTSTLTNPQHLFANTGNYAVNFTVTTSKGCPTAITRTITVNPNPAADFIKSADYVLAYDNVQFTDQSVPNPNITAWNWTFGNNGNSTTQNPNVTFPDKGIYPIQLVVTDNNGCKDTIVKDIYVTLLPLVPTAFTPNNDGTNDILYVKGGPFKSMSFRVYNNWGELLFTSDVQETGWDGTYKGQPAPLGVYVWILDVELYNGTQVRKTGDVTILK